MLLEDFACIVVEETGTLHIKGNNINLNGSGAVIILKGTLKTDDNVDFTFTGPGYIDIHPTHQIDMGANSNFVIERAVTQNKERFIRLRENTNLHLADRELRLHSGRVIYDLNSQISVTDGSIDVQATVFDDGNTSSTGLVGTNLNNCRINYCEFYGMDRGIHLTGNNTIPVIKFNYFQWNSKAMLAQEMDQIIIRDNQIIEQLTEGIRLESIDNAELTSNVIDGGTVTNDGLILDEVNTAWVGGTFIRNCEINGIRAEHSNVILNGGSTIENNLNGVFFENNATAEWAVSVGTCSCAHIINNGTWRFNY